ncbi:DHH family phosphoesterase [Metamycoplasma equirhinis]|uniref:DHH family phosphoesterase n=1 Tax=Metamycoplasma equirhinis TaxID=92402 RepID=A0ABZ0PAT4_9BACT|nr:DHH family phosphoesterase [Metamycoplasma equirhinis]TPD99396.1 hypothetical protein FJM08_00655 [Metamycoplasma equirhinis]WPB53862.1 DHH family phosphoesterase [Metamycoplasma equirhinis]BDX52902.1 DHH family phosphoesterase [Metamycoplasma equirhinis]
MQKKDKFKLRIILEVIFLFILPSILFYTLILLPQIPIKNSIRLTLSIVFMVYIICLGIYSWISLNSYLKKVTIARNSLNFYIQREIGQYGVGAISFLDTGKIVWMSSFVESRFTTNILGKNIKEVFGINEWNNNNLEFNFKKEHYEYETHISFEHNLVLIKDISIQVNLLNDYKRQRCVFGELSIDNMNIYQATLSQEEIFKLYAVVINRLDDLSKKTNIIYRQYENGRFFLILNQEILEQLETRRFHDFELLKNKQIIKGVNITVSIGFSYGLYKFSVLEQLAKEALIQSQARGGDQITVMTQNEKPRHYGSSSEIEINLSRTNVNYLAKNLIAKLKSNRIRKVIVYGHKDADLDALGSAYGIYSLAKSYGKEAYIQNKTFDQTTKIAMKGIVKGEKNILFISPKEATNLNDGSTLVVLCDTSDEMRIENSNAFLNIIKENIFVIDHHRIARNPSYAIHENSYVDSSASSASEIVTEIIAITNNKDRINSKVAQALLDGIYLDTNNFQKQTTSKTFAAASILQEWGAKINLSVNALKMNEEMFECVQKLTETISEVTDGYYLAYQDMEVPIDIISIAANEILRVNGRKAAFVVAKLPNSKKYKLSARGVETNVQRIAELVGGGGHFNTAAAETEESLDTFIGNIKQAIVSVKNESNIN